MTGIEVAQFVNDHGVSLFRRRKDAPLEYDVKPYFTGNKRGWVVLDHFTASAVLAVYKALDDQKKTVFETWSLQQQVKLAWKCVR